jgi:small subunit ribosomal protein S20
MANKRQAEKRAKQALTRQARNTSVKSTTKTAIRKVVDVLKAGTKDSPETLKAIRAIQRAAAKGVIPKGRASRKISRLTQSVTKFIANGSAAVTTAPVKKKAAAAKATVAKKKAAIKAKAASKNA